MPYVGYHPDRVKWALVLLLFSLVGYSEGDGATEDDFQTWHLPDGAVARLGKGDFRSVAFLGNDRFLRVITGSGVWVYEVATSRTLAFFPTGRVNSIAKSPNGTIVATAYDHTVQLWDPVTGESIATLEGHESQTGELDNYVWALSFSPDGVLLASGAGDGIKLWDVATRTEVAALPARMGPVTARITFSPDGTTIFARTGGCNYRLWDVEAKVEIDTPVLAPLKLGELQSRGGAILSPDATLVACTVWNWDWDTVDRVEVWNLRTGEEIVTLKANRCLEGSLLFSPDGTSLACGSERGFHLWDVENWESIPIERDQERVLSISFTPDGTTLASARRDGTVMLWDVASGKSIATIEAHEAQVLSVSFSSDGAILASGSSDGTVKLWDTETWQRTTTFSGHEGDFSAMAFSPDGTTLATGSGNGVRLWDMDTLNAVRMSHSPVYRVAFSPDGTTLATGGGRRIDLWNLSTGQRSNIIGCSRGGPPFAFADDGMLAVGCEETIRFWDVTLGDWVAIVDGLRQRVEISAACLAKRCYP